MWAYRKFEIKYIKTLYQKKIKTLYYNKAIAILISDKEDLKAKTFEV